MGHVFYLYFKDVSKIKDGFMLWSVSVKVILFRCVRRTKVLQRPHYVMWKIACVSSGYSKRNTSHGWKSRESFQIGKQISCVCIKNCISTIRVSLLIRGRAWISLQAPSTVVPERCFCLKSACCYICAFAHIASVAGVNVGLCAVIALHLSTSPLRCRR